MNKGLFLFWATMFLLVVLTISSSVSYRSFQENIGQVKELIESTTNAEVDSLLNAIRNDLLTDNFSQVALTFARISRSTNIVGLILERNGVEVFRTPSRFVVGENDLISRDLLFSENGKPWGKIRFAIDSKKAKAIQSGLRMGTLVSFLVLLTILTCSFFVLIFTIWKLSHHIVEAFSAATENRERANKPVPLTHPFRIWQPTIDRAAQIAFDYVTFRNRLEIFNRKEASYNLIAQIAHDLRSPLGALGISIQKMSGSSEANQLATNSLQRANQILNESLSAWKPESEPHKNKNDHRPRDMVEFNICSEVGLALSELRVRHPAASLELKSQLSETHLAQGDAFDFQRVLVNILENAIQAQGTHPKVLVELNAVGSLAIISIFDFGVGFSKTYLATPFQRGLSEKSNQTHSGTGLGLSFCQETIESWHGAISVSNHSGGGLVTIALPLVDQKVHSATKCLS